MSRALPLLAVVWIACGLASIFDATPVSVFRAHANRLKDAGL